MTISVPLRKGSVIQAHHDLESALEACIVEHEGQYDGGSVVDGAFNYRFRGLDTDKLIGVLCSMVRKAKMCSGAYVRILANNNGGVPNWVSVPLA